MPTLKLSVIIVNWNTRDLLDQCLQSLQAEVGSISHSICVVDNASKDGSMEMLREKHSSIIVIANPSNDGFAKGSNLGLRASPESDYVLFLNPDTFVQQGSIRGLIAHLETHPDVGAVTGALLDGHGHFQEAQGYRFPSIRTALNQYFFLNRLFSESLFPGIYWAKPPKRVQEVDWISGAVMMVRRSALLEGPFFDESYFMYAEDMEASLALRQRNWKLVMLPEIRLAHYVKQGTRQSEGAIARSPIASQLLYLQRHTTSWQYRWIRLFMSIGFSLRYVAYRLLGLLRANPFYDEKARHHRNYLSTLGVMRSA